MIRHLIGDARGYWDWAGRIAAGDWVGSESFYQAPLYPYFLAVCFRVFGESVAAVRLVQCVAGAVAAGCFYLGARRWFGPRAALIAGLMLAFYPPAIFADGVIQKTSLTMLGVSVLFALTAPKSAPVSVMRLALVGVVSGLLVLLRENAMVWAPVLAVWSGWRLRGASDPTAKAMGHPRPTPHDPTAEAMGHPRPTLHDPTAEATGHPNQKGADPIAKATGHTHRRDADPTAKAMGHPRVVRGADPTGTVRGVVAYLAGLAVVLGPVAIRNRAVSGEWSLSTFQAGPNFYIGNHRGADGRYQPLVRGHEEPAFERKDATELAERDVGRKLSASEVSNYWMQRAWQDIRTDPTSWFQLMGRKFWMVLNAYEVSDVESQYVFAEYSRVLRWVSPVWHFGVLLPLAAVGFAVTAGRWREFWLHYALSLSMIAAVAAFYVLARYRAPIVPLLIPFAAAGCVWLCHLLSLCIVALRGRRGGGVEGKTSKHRKVEASKCAGDKARCYTDAAGDEAGRSRRLDLPYLLRAGDQSRGYTDGAGDEPRRYIWAGALGIFVAVFANWPVHDVKRLNALSWMNVGVALARAGEVGAATSFFRTAVRHFPESAEANNNLAQAMALQGEYAGAIPHYQAALRADPALMGVHYNLGVALERVGRVREAVEHYRRAMELDPNDAEAREAVRRLEG